MAFLPLAATMGLQAFGAIYQSQVASAEASANAAQAEVNARAVRQETAVREDIIRAANRRKMGQQRAAAVQSGFDPNAGSFLSLQGDSAGALEFDALTARYEGVLKSSQLDYQAKMYKAQAKSAKATGYLNAAGQLLGGVSKAYGSGASFG